MRPVPVGEPNIRSTSRQPADTNFRLWTRESEFIGTKSENDLGGLYRPGLQAVCRGATGRDDSAGRGTLWQQCGRKCLAWNLFRAGDDGRLGNGELAQIDSSDTNNQGLALYKLHGNTFNYLFHDNHVSSYQIQQTVGNRNNQRYLRLPRAEGDVDDNALGLSKASTVSASRHSI